MKIRPLPETDLANTAALPKERRRKRLERRKRWRGLTILDLRQHCDGKPRGLRHFRGCDVERLAQCLYLRTEGFHQMLVGTFTARRFGRSRRHFSRFKLGLGSHGCFQRAKIVCLHSRIWGPNARLFSAVDAILHARATPSCVRV